jgi:hypothetical protein
MKKVIELPTNIHLEDIKHVLQTKLSISELVDFAIDLSNDREYLYTLKEQLCKMNLDQ